MTSESRLYGCDNVTSIHPLYPTDHQHYQYHYQSAKNVMPIALPMQHDERLPAKENVHAGPQ